MSTKSVFVLVCCFVVGAALAVPAAQGKEGRLELPDRPDLTPLANSFCRSLAEAQDMSDAGLYTLGTLYAGDILWSHRHGGPGVSPANMNQVYGLFRLLTGVSATWLTVWGSDKGAPLHHMLTPQAIELLGAHVPAPAHACGGGYRAKDAYEAVKVPARAFAAAALFLHERDWLHDNFSPTAHFESDGEAYYPRCDAFIDEVQRGRWLGLNEDVDQEISFQGCSFWLRRRFDGTHNSLAHIYYSQIIKPYDPRFVREHGTLIEGLLKASR